MGTKICRLKLLYIVLFRIIYSFLFFWLLCYSHFLNSGLVFPPASSDLVLNISCFPLYLRLLLRFLKVSPKQSVQPHVDTGPCCSSYQCRHARMNFIFLKPEQATVCNIYTQDPASSSQAHTHTSFCYLSFLCLGIPSATQNYKQSL